MTALADAPATRELRPPMVDVLGGAPVTVLVEDAFGVMVEVDPCRIVGELTIRYGRSSVSTPVAEPATATVQVIAPPGDAAALYPLRRRLEVNLSAAAMAYWSIQPTGLHVKRFSGRIVEVDVDSDPALGAVLTVIAAGPVGDLGRIRIGAEPWPAELAIARVRRVIALAGFGTTGGTGKPDPPGATNVLPRDVDRQTALDLIATYADEGLTYVVDERIARDQIAVYDTLATAVKVDEALDLPDPLSAAVLVLDACDLFTDWSAVWDMAGMLNRLSIGYGPAPDGGEQPRAVFTDEQSLERFGVLEDSMTTDLATAADATSLATARFAALATPTPHLPELRCDLWLTLDVDEGHRYLMLHPNDLLGLTGIPPAVPVNRAGLVVVNGYAEAITADAWAVTLSVFDPLPGGNTQLWYLIPADWVWEAVPGDVLWSNSGDFDW